MHLGSGARYRRRVRSRRPSGCPTIAIRWIRSLNEGFVIGKAAVNHKIEFSGFFKTIKGILFGEVDDGLESRPLWSSWLASRQSDLEGAVLGKITCHGGQRVGLV